MMSYGDKEWSEWVIDDQEECNKHVRTAFEHGVNTLDTANMYSQGLSEVMTGKAIRAVGVPREEWVILTKVCTHSGVAPGAASKHTDVRNYLAGPHARQGRRTRRSQAAHNGR